MSKYNSGVGSKHELRRVERLVDTNAEFSEWTECLFQELNPGQVFRMFEPDGTPVDGASGPDYMTCGEVYVSKNSNGDDAFTVEIMGLGNRYTDNLKVLFP